MTWNNPEDQIPLCQYKDGCDHSANAILILPRAGTVVAACREHLDLLIKAIEEGKELAKRFPYE